MYDYFKAQCTNELLLRENYIDILNSTDRLQPLDVCINKSALGKIPALVFVASVLSTPRRVWWSETIGSTSKPLGAKWLMEIYDHLKK